MTPIARGTSSLVAADLDHDGDADLVLNQRGEQAAVSMNDGTGRFAEPVPVGPALLALRSVDVADVDGDTFPDLVVAGTSPGSPVPGTGPAAAATLSVLHGNGIGGFARESTIGFRGHESSVVGIADLDGDGLTDLLVGHGTDRRLSVLLADATGAFRRAERRSFRSDSALALADVDGDCAPDVVAAVGGTLSVHLNTRQFLCPAAIPPLLLQGDLAGPGSGPGPAPRSFP